MMQTGHQMCFVALQKWAKLYKLYDLKVGKEEYHGNCTVSLESTSATSVQVYIVCDNICQIETYIVI